MHHPIDRRGFLQSAAALTLAGSATALAQDKTLPVIDTHQHLWDLSKFKLPWLKNAVALNQSYVMEDYLKAASELKPPTKLTKTIYMEVDVAPDQQQAEADYVLDICKQGKTPMVAAVVSGRPNSDGFAKYAKQFKDSKYIKGIRQVLHGDGTPKGYCLDKQFIAGIHVLGELGLSFDLCMRPAEQLDAAKLIDACPDTRFILDHCGNANVQAKDRTQWQRDLAEVAKRKNVVCKVSGFIATAPKDRWTAADLAPIVNHTLDSFGPDRVMFGGDWPVCTLAATLGQWVAALYSIARERKEEEQRKLFAENATRFYRLE